MKNGSTAKGGTVLTGSTVAALRVASKTGFLSKATWNKHLSYGHRSWRFRQWKALTEEGFFIPCRDYGFTADALILSQKGIEAAMKLGLDPVNPPGAKNLWHDDDLVSMALTLEKDQLISWWLTESELKSGRMRELFRYQADSRHVKFPDLVLQLKHPQDRILWAVELERTRKERTRYYDMVQSYSEIAHINAVLVIVAAPSIEDNIKKSISRMSYPQGKRPMLFATHSDFLSAPGTAELRLGDKKSSIATAVSRWQNAGSQNVGSKSNPGGNMERNNVASASRGTSQHKGNASA